MNARPIAWSAALCLFALVVPAPSHAMLRQSLHGKWSATLTPEDGGNGHDHTDTFTFANGDTFTTDEMAKQGFEPGQYSGRGTPIGAAEQFETTLTNKAGDTAHWQGQNVGGEMTGTVTITRKNGDVTSFTFRATRK